MFFLRLVFIFITAAFTKSLFFSTYFRPEVDLATACWNYHLFGIPVDEDTGLGVICCEAGQRVERTVDIQLAGYVSWNCKQMGQEGVCYFITVFRFIVWVLSSNRLITQNNEKPCS